jgi:CheY-like chemotaxis protein
LIHTAIYLSKILIQQQQQKSPYQQVLKYLEVLQLAQIQRQQSLDISLLLVAMPLQITSILFDVIDRLRQQYLPKALQPQRLSAQLIAFVLSECPRDRFDAFAQALEQKLQPMPTLILVHAQHPRHPHFLLADALLRLDLMEKAKQNIHYCHYDHLRFEKQMRQLPPLIDLQDHYAAHVFIIDRDLSAVHPLKRLFEEQSLIVNCFESASQVRSLMGQLTYLPQVLVINCDGHDDLVEEAMQLLSAIKQDYPGIKVMISAIDMIEDKMEESFARGADDFLRKPFLMKEVLLRLMKLIM